MKKLFLLGILMLLFCMTFASAACNWLGYNYTTATNVSRDFKAATNDSLNDATNRYINGSEDRTITSIVEITPTLTRTYAQCDSYTNISNSTALILVYLNIDSASNLTVVNKENSSEIMTAGNRTVNVTTGRVTTFWDSAGNFTFSNKNLTVCYNKTFIKDVADLVDYTALTNIGSEMYSTTGTFGSYNNQIGMKTAAYYTVINNTDWVVTYQFVDRACSDQATMTSCARTQATIYAAFGLIALFAIVLAAFVIIGMFKDGNVDGGTIIATIIGMIGLAVVILVAFVITNNVGMTTCGV